MAGSIIQTAKTRGGTQAVRHWSETLGRPFAVCVLLSIATLIVYLPVATLDFVNYDDADYVTANLHVQGGLTSANVTWAFRTGHASNWHPLTWLSHMLDLQLFGRNPGPQHLVNLAFHIANTVMLFLVMRRLTRSHWGSAMLAALFALHPLHVESVAWISERKDVLSTFFLLLTITAYARYAQTQVAAQERSGGKLSSPSPPLEERRPLHTQVQRERELSNKSLSPNPLSGMTKSAKAQATPEAKGHGSKSKVQRSRPEIPSSKAEMQSPPPSRYHALSSPFYIAALALFACGLMSKPMLVTLPFMLLLLDWWPLRRAPEFGFGQANLKGWGLLLFEKAPFFLLTAVSSVITFRVQEAGGAVSASLTLGQRLTNAVVSYVRYLGKTLWPKDLAVLYPHPGNWPVWQVVGSLIIVLAITFAIVFLARKRPYLGMGWFWFLGGLVPVIGIVQVGIQSMADRYTYVPLIGIFLMLVWGVCELVGPQPSRAKALIPIGALVLLICAGFTHRQVLYWRDSETLFAHAVEVSPDNYLAYNNLGYYFFNHGRTAEALENYQKSLRINPNYEDALNNVGHALATAGRPQEAIPYYEAALRVRPNHVEVHNNLGNALSDLGRLDQAIQHYRIALWQNPEHADAHNNLGVGLAMQGKVDEAIPHFFSAIKYKPTDASAHSNLGNAFAVQHRLDEAIAQYEESLRLNPNDAQAHNNLGNVFSQQGRLDEAIAEYNVALRLNADNPEAHLNLGIVLSRKGEREQAIAHYRESLRLKPDYDEARRQLERLAPAR